MAPAPLMEKQAEADPGRAAKKMMKYSNCEKSLNPVSYNSKFRTDANIFYTGPTRYSQPTPGRLMVIARIIDFPLGTDSWCWR